MKMETPKMDVVRFQEADVIVASPIPATPVFLTGFKDTSANNGKVSFDHNGQSYLFETKNYNDATSFANAVTNAGVADVNFNDNSDPDNHSLNGLFYADIAGESLPIPDGTYYWNPSTRSYRMQ